MSWQLSSTATVRVSPNRNATLIIEETESPVVYRAILEGIVGPEAQDAAAAVDALRTHLLRLVLAVDSCISP